MIRVLLSERIRKTAARLPDDIREKAAKAIADVAAACGDPHRHRRLGLRKLGARSYEVRVYQRWRVVFVLDGKERIAFDIMNHDEVARWLRGQRK